MKAEDEEIARALYRLRRLPHSHGLELVASWRARGLDVRAELERERVARARIRPTPPKRVKAPLDYTNITLARSFLPDDEPLDPDRPYGESSFLLVVRDHHSNHRSGLVTMLHEKHRRWMQRHKALRTKAKREGGYTPAMERLNNRLARERMRILHRLSKAQHYHW